MLAKMIRNRTLHPKLSMDIKKANHETIIIKSSPKANAV